VHWCLNCRSALAEAEVEYEDKTSPSIYVRFPVVDSAYLRSARIEEARKGGRRAPESATSGHLDTTPWTLPANRAVAVHPQFDYALIEFYLGRGAERLVLAVELIDAVMTP